ncbi:hypothetical protein BV898_19936 [Hypsibius exemplaris]|uniref:Uncharacterized protein n=1 Tax=Hypsibius exemplaris TaxID=2072580 RepID=A0A9X6RPY3_HYPEX|nr:hypothetical protein BV898_19936 [Hypsibius exemplaris]
MPNLVRPDLFLLSHQAVTFSRLQLPQLCYGLGDYQSGHRPRPADPDAGARRTMALMAPRMGSNLLAYESNGKHHRAELAATASGLGNRTIQLSSRRERDASSISNTVAVRHTSSRSVPKKKLGLTISLPGRKVTHGLSEIPATRTPSGVPPG